MLVNIITRTSGRPLHFKICKDSIMKQNYKEINHIVGMDCTCDYTEGFRLKKKTSTKKKDAIGKYPAPWNLYLNELAEMVTEGMVIYLDDDDELVNEKSLETIMSFYKHDNQIILWLVDINGRIVPKPENVGKIVANDISGIGFMFHSKHLPVDWGSWSGGDYRVISKLAEKLEQVWVREVLTKTQGKPNRGRKV